MANRTDKEAASIHGTNPQNLVENIVRQKIYQTIYWKESCFALTAESLIDKAVDLKAVGGTHGGARLPSHFLCLILKMLQIQPHKEIIIEYIKNEEFKYVRVLGAFYMRLVGKPLEVYQYLEPLYNDYRKVRVQLPDGGFALSHMDEVVDDMLRKDYMFDIALPRIPSRVTLERLGQLEPRLSVLDEEFDEAALEVEAGEAQKEAEQAAAAAERERQAADTAAETRGRDDDEQRDTERRKEERAREKWREDPRERRDRERDRERDRDRDRDRYDDHGRDRDDDRDRERRSSRYDERDRDRDRERDRDRDRRRGRSPESPDRRRRERERTPDRDRDRSKPVREEYKGAAGGKKGVDLADPEIVAANEMRAKLGLKPLK